MENINDKVALGYVQIFAAHFHQRMNGLSEQQSQAWVIRDIEQMMDVTLRDLLAQYGITTPEGIELFMAYGIKGLYGKTLDLLQRSMGTTTLRDTLSALGLDDAIATLLTTALAELYLRSESLEATPESANGVHEYAGRLLRSNFTNQQEKGPQS